MRYFVACDAKAKMQCLRNRLVKANTGILRVAVFRMRRYAGCNYERSQIFRFEMATIKVELF